MSKIYLSTINECNLFKIYFSFILSIFFLLPCIAMANTTAASFGNYEEDGVVLLYDLDDSANAIGNSNVLSPLAGSGTCTDVTATGGAGTVSINNIPTAAQVEISGPSTGWGLQSVCNGNCSGTEQVNNLSEGVYSVKIQTFNPYCYTQIDVTVSGGSTNQCTESLVEWNLDDCFIANCCESDPWVEFSPSYIANTDCGTINATNVNRVKVTLPGSTRNENGHSCLEGEEGKGICIAGDSESFANFSSERTLKFSATFPAGYELSGLNFYQKSEDFLTGIIGNSGTPANNPLRKFGVQARINGQLIFESLNNNTSSNGWALANIDFNSNNSFSFTRETTVEFELLGYDREILHADSRIKHVWEVDEIKILGCCSAGGGSLCDGQGGDSDGDGICDNQDNCDFVANADQADNDGDGIGNVCDSTPNGTGGGGNTGGGTCTDVTATGGAGTVSINNIPTAAQVEISGPSTGWGLQSVCNGNCSGTEQVNNLSEGVYSVKIQTFNPYCYTQIDVTVTGGSTGGGGSPCDGQGGDSDGDGICDNQDNCDFVANADQADNDGDGIGNVCDSTPNGTGGGGNTGGGTCTDVTATGGAGTVSINNIPTAAQVEISGPSTGWGLQSVCNGNCSGTEQVNNLSAGVYSVKIQTFNPYCYTQIDVTVTGGNTGGGSPCDGQGGDSDGDGICDNQDNCDFVANADQADNDGDGIGNACDSTPNGNTGGSVCDDAKVVMNTTNCLNGISHVFAIFNKDNPVNLNYYYHIGEESTISWQQCDDGTAILRATNLPDSRGLDDMLTSLEVRFSDFQSTPNSEGFHDNDCGDSFDTSDWNYYLSAEGTFTTNKLGTNDIFYNSDDHPKIRPAFQIGTGANDRDNPSELGAGGWFYTSNETWNSMDIQFLLEQATCNDVVASTENNTINIANIPSSAQVDISGPSTGWGLQSVCNGNCSGTEQVNNLSAGVYSVKIQTFNPYCYTQIDVTVTGGNTGGGSPCDGQGGDSDGDGICDNQDNCDFVANADQADNDGDGIGNACDSTPNGNTGGSVCDDAKVVMNTTNCLNGISHVFAIFNKDNPVNLNYYYHIGEESTISWQQCDDGTAILRATNLPDSRGLDDMLTSLEVRFSDFQSTPNSEGFHDNDCGDSFDTSDWNYYLSAEGTFTTNKLGTNDIFYNSDDHPKIRPAFQIGTGANDRDNPSELGAGGWFYTSNETWNSMDIQFLLEQATCNDVVASTENNTINIANIPSSAQVDIFGPSTGWSLQSVCNGNCSGIEQVNNLSEGVYSIKVQTFNPYCYKQLDVTVTNGNGSAGSRASLNFTAYEASRQVGLQWATNTTYKNDYYIIEKSTDGIEFTELTKVMNTDTHAEMEAYQAMDETPQLGANYYRLKQVYLDGSHTYTPTEKIDFQIDLGKLSIYPNPATDVLNLNLQPVVGKEVTIRIVNTFGQIVKDKDIGVLHQESVQIELGDAVPNGLYQVLIGVEGQKLITKKLLIQKLY